MKAVRTLGAAAVLLATLPPHRLCAQYPTRPPEPAPLRPVNFPPLGGGRLRSGLELLVVRNDEQPVITVSLTLRAGSLYDPEGKEGLSELLSELITKGTSRRTADQLASEIESAGGSIGAVSGRDFLTVTISTLSENLPRALEVLADVVTGSTFPEREFELARTRALSSLQASLAQPAYLADRAFRREVFGRHPYGRAMTPASLRAITRDDVVAFFRARVRPAGALLVLAGDVESAAAMRLASTALASWSGASEPDPRFPEPPARTATEIVLVHRPGSVQSNIVAGFPFITARDPDYYALTLMNRILGGGADSRLFMILREQRGWTYGAYSSFSRERFTGSFQAGAEVRTEVTDSALAELVRQLERMRNEPPSDSELVAAKNYLVGRFPLTIETPEEIAREVGTARLLGLPGDYVQRYRERLAAVTATQIARAARARLQTDRMLIVVVGDGPRVLAGLRRIAPVRIVDGDGRPLTEADLTPRAAAVRPDGSRIAPANLRTRILVQGREFGTESRTIERAETGGRAVWRAVSSTGLGPIMRQDDTVLVDAVTLAPVSVRRSGRQMNQDLFVRLDYEGNRVRGQSRSAAGPGQSPQDRTIDTTLAEGTLDDHSLFLVIAALPYSAGARFTLPVFSGDQARVEQLTLTVSGEESVTVPAGTFACWRVEVTGGPIPIVAWVTREAPYLLAKVELTGQPVAFELVSREQR
ncbi:MAG TPA: insulinase family protein [Gemmatimonadales bacterium]|nr:insulinase family protein [Gemmatimonadales bacterium]